MRQQWQGEARCTSRGPTYKLIGVGKRFLDYLVQLGVLEMTKLEVGRDPEQRSGGQPMHLRLLPVVALEWLKEMEDFLIGQPSRSSGRS